MTEPKKQVAAPERPKVRFTPDGLVEYPVFQYRFLFGNGDTLDVQALRDDSDLRAAVLTHRKIKEDRVVGVSDGVVVGWVTVS